MIGFAAAFAAMLALLGMNRSTPRKRINVASSRPEPPPRLWPTVLTRTRSASVSFGEGVRRVTRRRGQDPDAEQWAEALSQIARSVRAGESMHGSVLTLSPWTSHPPLQRATTRLQAGSDLVTALEPDPDQPVEGHAAVALAALRVCARHGGRVAHALDATAATLRMRAAADQERVVFASQARMSSKVLSLLPGAVALWTMSTDERAREVWFGGSFGLILLSVGLALNLVGWMWMRAIVGAS